MHLWRELLDVCHQVSEADAGGLGSLENVVHFVPHFVRVDVPRLEGLGRLLDNAAEILAEHVSDLDRLGRYTLEGRAS